MAQTSTTDLFNEPIVARGLQARYRLVGYPRTDDDQEMRETEIIEVLLDVDGGNAFAAEVERRGQLYALAKPVCEIVLNEGGGAWCLVEAMGPRALVCDLMVLAQEFGCERRDR